MEKPQLCLALSVGLTLMQANLLPAQSEPASGSIWQQLSGTAGATTKAPGTVKKPVAVQRAVKPATLPDAHAMLFIKGKQNAVPGTVAPAAALTIHPALPDSAEAAMIADSDASNTATTGLATVSPTPAVDAIPQATASAPVVNNYAPSATSKDQQASGNAPSLLAQLAPDQVVAQSTDAGNVTATPIPPVVTGTVDLEEFKTTNVIDLKVSQSRTFKLKNKIVRTSISDPAIAEPVVVSENQLVLLGKTPGTATMVLWDDAGNSVAIDLRVTRDYGQLQSTLREIDPRIIVKAFSVGGSDRVLLLGDVDHPDSVIRAFSASNVFMDDRGMTIQVANSRLINARVGEQGGTQTGGGQQTGQLAALSSVGPLYVLPELEQQPGQGASHHE